MPKYETVSLDGLGPDYPDAHATTADDIIDRVDAERDTDRIMRSPYLSDRQKAVAAVDFGIAPERVKAIRVPVGGQEGRVVHLVAAVHGHDGSVLDNMAEALGTSRLKVHRDRLHFHNTGPHIADHERATRRLH